MIHINAFSLKNHNLTFVYNTTKPNSFHSSQRAFAEKTKKDNTMVTMALPITLFFLFLLTVGINSTFVAPGIEDLITDLPGEPSEVGFVQYAGRIKVDDDGNRALFYWLVEATEKQLLKPLVLWLNGGPGCSSLAGGAFQEIGPFRVQEDGVTLALNPSAWNTESNILFLESPAGVGFSLLQESQTQGDNTTAEDVYTFLLHWLLRFPQYNSRDFYLAGESYAGHYLPQLAQVILRMEHPFIKLKGFLLGNPTIDSNIDYLGQIEYWWSQGLVSQSTKNMLMQNCPFDSFLHPQPPCKAALDNARAEFGPIDAYNIFSNPCHDDVLMEMGPTATMFGGTESCFLNNTKKYLNLEVQKAIHADQMGSLYRWAACNISVFNLWGDSPNSVLPILKELVVANLRIWIFSGNTDAMVPVTSTRNLLTALNLTIVQKWYPWADDNGQVGGWAEVYEGLNFVIIRGAGHQVPLNRPEQALLMFKKFLSDERMPSITASGNNLPPPSP